MLGLLRRAVLAYLSAVAIITLEVQDNDRKETGGKTRHAKTERGKCAEASQGRTGPGGDDDGRRSAPAMDETPDWQA